MATLSKVTSPEGVTDYFLRSFIQNRKKHVLGLSMIGVIGILIKMRNEVRKSESQQMSEEEKEALMKKKKEKSKGQIDWVFVKRMKELMTIVVPGWKCLEFLDMAQMTCFLIIRTFLSIYIASINGKIVKSLIEVEFWPFVDKIVNLGLIAIPASFINSYLEYLNKRLALRFRRRITQHFMDKYLQRLISYELVNIDHRLPNPDQILTTDLDKWSSSLSSLFNNITKPFLDIMLFGGKLVQFVGFQGPLLIFIWYCFSAAIMRIVSPSFGKLTAVEQRLEGQYRSCHSALMNHSEEIGFYRGHQWEKQKLLESFEKLIQHNKNTIYKKLYMGSFDALLVKYGASTIGYTVVGLPVFGPNSRDYLKKVQNDPGVITKDYMRNSSLLINLAKAIGRIVVSYKELQSLAGYTFVIYEIQEVIHQLTTQHTTHDAHQRIVNTSSHLVKFEDVDIVTPTDDILVQSLSFEVHKGNHLIITGPNGCGKTSLFRLLGGLWRLHKGRIVRPSDHQVFYVPQKPYLPRGSLRDQIIYPHTHQQMLQKGVTDQHLEKALGLVHLSYLIKREGGFGAVNEWNDVLSGGEKQRIAFSRLFYHRPVFAVLDECTSAVSMDVESTLFQNCKDHGITLFSVSLRTSLYKHHDYTIVLNGDTTYSFHKINEKDFENLKTVNEIQPHQGMIQWQEAIQSEEEENNQQIS